MNENTNTTRISKFFSSLISLIIVIVIFLWNWDGFWQSDIKPLIEIQKKYFYSKYSKEQQKLSSFSKNHEMVEALTKKLEKSEWKNNENRKEIEELRSELRKARKSGIEEYKRKVIAIINELDAL